MRRSLISLVEPFYSKYLSKSELRLGIISGKLYVTRIEECMLSLCRKSDQEREPTVQIMFFNYFANSIEKNTYGNR